MMVNTTGQRVRSKPGTGVSLSENLAPQQQPGAAQLMRKLQNRLRRRRQERNQPPLTSKASRPRGGPMEGTALSYSPPASVNKTVTPEEISPEQEEGIGEQLETTREEARAGKAAQNKGREVKLLQNAANKLNQTIWKNRTKMPLLLGVMVIALLKDFLDIMGEFFTAGIWSWFDWMLDLSLGIATYLLGIEKNSQDRMIGWAMMGVEVIPYAGVLPVWTLRVARAMYKAWKEINASKSALNKIQNRLAVLQTA